MCNFATSSVIICFGQVRDRRDEEFIFRLPWKKFPGEGQAVHGDEFGLCCKHHTDAPKCPTSPHFNSHAFCWSQARR